MNNENVISSKSQSQLYPVAELRLPISNNIASFYSIQQEWYCTYPLKFNLNLCRHLFIYFNGNTDCTKHINKQEDGCSQKKLRSYELMVGIYLSRSQMISIWSFLESLKVFQKLYLI